MADQGTYTATNLPADGQTIDAADVNTDLQGLIDEFNKNVGTDKITDAAVTGAKLATSAITIGYAEVTANQAGITTETDLTGLAVTVVVPAGGRRMKITACVRVNVNTAGAETVVRIKEGATYMNAGQLTCGSSARGYRLFAMDISTPTAGTHTYKLSLSVNTGTVLSEAANEHESFILVEMI